MGVEQEAEEGPTLLWDMVFQLQAVGVPLTVLLLGAMGIRAYQVAPYYACLP
jgi:hypothetical protein